jgi:hypothetical protein
MFSVTLVLNSTRYMFSALRKKRIMYEDAVNDVNNSYLYIDLLIKEKRNRIDCIFKLEKLEARVCYKECNKINHCECNSIRCNVLQSFLLIMPYVFGRNNIAAYDFYTQLKNLLVRNNYNKYPLHKLLSQDDVNQIIKSSLKGITIEYPIQKQLDDIEIYVDHTKANEKERKLNTKWV